MAAFEGQSLTGKKAEKEGGTFWKEGNVLYLQRGVSFTP